MRNPATPAGHNPANYPLWFGLCASLTLCACSDRNAGRAEDDSPQTQAETAPGIEPLTVTDLNVDAAAGPRDGNGFITGETVRIGLRIAGGQPPYRGVIRAHQIGASPGTAGDSPGVSPGVSPISAEFRPQSQPDSQPDSHGASPLSDAIEVGLRAVLQPQARSGVYQLRATVTDAAGRQATATSADMSLIGADAEVLPAEPAEPGDNDDPHLAVHDIAGRRRLTFVRGEAVTIDIRLPGAREALIKVSEPGGAIMAATTLPVSRDGAIRMPVAIPRLAQLGVHTITATARTGTPSVTGTLEVVGRPWPPASKLIVDAMAVYGGRDGRAVRTGTLQRGEALTLEARIGGGRQRVELSVRLSGHVGVVSDQVLGHATIERPSPMRRVYISGSWTVPTAIPVGRYQLQLQATEGERVSMRAREVIIR